MNRLSVQGLRGGVGSTSLVAALGSALAHSWQRVLLVDLCQENLLHLHCGQGVATRGGWTRALLDGDPPDRAVQRIDGSLSVLPYGLLDDAERGRLQALLAQRPNQLEPLLEHMEGAYDWVLFDLPLHDAVNAVDVGACEVPIRVLEADPACHVLLERTDATNAWWLVNRYDPSRQLQRDLQLVWREQKRHRFIPVWIHADAAMPEALASRMAVGQYAANSQAAADVNQLAAWSRAQVAP